MNQLVLDFRPTTTTLSNDCEAVLAMLRRGPATSFDVLQEVGTERAGARIYDLRRAGYRIKTKSVTVKRRDGRKVKVAEYVLEDK